MRSNPAHRRKTHFLQSPRGARAPHISQRRGTAPDGAPGRGSLRFANAHSFRSTTGFLMCACVMASLKDLKILISQQNRTTSAHSRLPTGNIYIKYIYIFYKYIYEISWNSFHSSSHSHRICHFQVTFPDDDYGFLIALDKRTSAKHCPWWSKHLPTSKEDVFLRAVLLETAAVGSARSLPSIIKAKGTLANKYRTNF